MKRILAWPITMAVALLALACGDDDKKEQRHGALDVQVLAVGHGGPGPLTSDVRAIVIELDGDVDYQLTLTKRSDIEYIGTFTKVFAGEYIASALAYDNFEGQGDPLFREEKASPIAIEKGKTAGLVFAISQLLPDEEFTLPHFTSVALDRTTVDQDATLLIEVEARGGVGALTLSGRHAPGAEVVGLFDDPHFDPATETGKIGWKAPKVAGPIWFALVLTDTLGNQGELGITVFVGADKNSVQVTAAFNLAPDLDLQVRTLDDAGTTTINLAIDAADNTPGPMTFLLESDCGGQLDPPISGNIFEQDSPAQAELTYVIEGREGSCWLSVKVSDAEGASSKKIVTLGEVVNPEGPVSTIFGGFDAIDANEFAPITIQPTLASTYHANANIVARFFLSKAGEPVSGDFARYEDDYVSSVSAGSPNKLTLSSFGRAVFGPETGFAAADLKAGPTWRLGVIGLGTGEYTLEVEYIEVTANNTSISLEQVEFTVQ